MAVLTLQEEELVCKTAGAWDPKGPQTPLFWIRVKSTLFYNPVFLIKASYTVTCK